MYTTAQYASLHGIYFFFNFADIKDDSYLLPLERGCDYVTRGEKTFLLSTTYNTITPKLMRNNIVAIKTRNLQI